MLCESKENTISQLQYVWSFPHNYYMIICVLQTPIMPYLCTTDQKAPDYLSCWCGFLFTECGGCWIWPAIRIIDALRYNWESGFVTALFRLLSIVVLSMVFQGKICVCCLYAGCTVYLGLVRPPMNAVAKSPLWYVLNDMQSFNREKYNKFS